MAEEQDDKETGSASPKAGDEALIETARKRFKLSEEAERDIRDAALEDMKFRRGNIDDQWAAGTLMRRRAAKKACLVLNVLPAREHLVLNDQRQNRPQVKVHPVDDGADPKTAEIIQGMIRHIHYDSNAETAIDTAAEGAYRGGFGYFRLITEFEEPTNFRQVIKIKRIPNPFSVYMDPNCREADYSDANFAFITETLTKEDYLEQYSKGQLASLDDWESIGDKDPDWLSKDGCRIAEYLYREMKADTLYLLRNQAGEEKAFLSSQLPDGKPPKRVKVVDKRETEVPVIHWCKHNAVEVLERSVWLGQWIPIIPVLGDEIIIDGKRSLEGGVRHVKDAVRMKNVMASGKVDSIAIVPKPIILAAEGQIEGLEKAYERASRGELAVLPYKVVDVGGRPIPPPQVISTEPAIAAISEAEMHFQADLEAITGIYAASRGEPSNEKSGKAIDARVRRGEVSNFHFTDNTNRAIRFLGIQLVDLIPKIYTAPQVMRIIGDDGAHKKVFINGPDPKNPKQPIYDLKAGRYDVTMSAGPSFQTKRLEGAEWIQNLLSASPELMKYFGDLFFKILDLPYADQLAERAKRMLPPELQDDDNSDPKAQVAKLQALLKAMSQQHQILVEGNKRLLEEREKKILELQSAEKINHDKIEGQITIAEITTKAQDLRERQTFVEDMQAKLLELRSEMEQKMSDHAHEFAMDATDKAHERSMQEGDQAHEFAMDDQTTDNAMVTAEHAAAIAPEPATQV